MSTSDIEGATSYYGSRTVGLPVHSGGCGVIPAGKGLRVGQSIHSCDGRFQLALQSDGNLVLYQGSTALWSTGTSGHLAVQTDGNVVIYSASGQPLWHAGTGGR